MRLKHDASHSCRHMGMSMTAGGNLGTYQDPWMTGPSPVRLSRTLAAAAPLSTTFSEEGNNLLMGLHNPAVDGGQHGEARCDTPYPAPLFWDLRRLDLEIPLDPLSRF